MLAKKALNLFTKETEQTSSPSLDLAGSSTGLGLKDYLYYNPLETNLPLSPTGEMSFHWGDWKESCDFQRSLVKEKNSNGISRLNTLDKMIIELQGQPVWVNNKVKTVQMSLYDLYRSYLDPRIRQVWFYDTSKQFLVSMSSESGPYVLLNSLRWFDKEIYSYFVFKKLLNENTANRNFRIALNSPVICHFDNGLLDVSHVCVHQITKGGILFKIKRIEIFNRMLVTERLAFEFDTSLFKKLGKSKTAKEFKSILGNETIDLSEQKKRQIFSIPIKEVATRYGNLENYKLSNSKDFFLFIGWQHFKVESQGEHLGELMNYFMGGALFVFNKEMDKIS